MDPILIPLSLAALALLLLRRWKRRKAEEEQEFRGSFGSSGDRASGFEARDEYAEDQRRAAEAAEQREKEALVRKALAGDPLLAEALGNLAGIEHAELRGANDQSLVQDIARRLSKDTLQIFNIAATQQEIRINLQATTEREPVNYPTADMEPTFLTDLDQLTSVLPDQLMQSDDQFYANLAAGELQVIQAYERLQRQQALEIILDVSGSMDTAMSNGISRHVWARGVTITQLMRAVKGQAKYLLRPFDGQPHPLQRATNAQEAGMVIRNILNFTTTGGGTDIPAAIKQAAEDIRSLGGDLSKAAILLISDGEDSSIDINQIRALLGKDIQLHVVMIGSDNASLRQVAATYKRFE